MQIIISSGVRLQRILLSITKKQTMKKALELINELEFDLDQFHDISFNHQSIRLRCKANESTMKLANEYCTQFMMVENNFVGYYTKSDVTIFIYLSI